MLTYNKLRIICRSMPWIDWICEYSEEVVCCVWCDPRWRPDPHRASRASGLVFFLSARPGCEICRFEIIVWLLRAHGGAVRKRGTHMLFVETLFFPETDRRMRCSRGKKMINTYGDEFLQFHLPLHPRSRARRGRPRSARARSPLARPAALDIYRLSRLDGLLLSAVARRGSPLAGDTLPSS